MWATPAQGPAWEGEFRSVTNQRRKPGGVGEQKKAGAAAAKGGMEEREGRMVRH